MNLEKNLVLQTGGTNLTTIIREMCNELILNIEIDSRGSPESKICIIVDSPTLVDVKNGRLMSGSSADILRKELLKIGIDMDKCWITCCIRHHVEIGALAYEKVQNQPSSRYYWDVLKEELKRLKCKYVLCLGGHASAFFTEKAGIGRLRGTYEEFGDKIVFYSNNPAMLGRDARLYKMLAIDIQRFGRIINGQRERFYGRVIQSKKEISFAEFEEKVAFDCEVVGGIIAAISFCDSKNGFSIPFINERLENKWSKEDEVEIREMINKFCASHKMICQNALFDVPFMVRQGFKLFEVWADPMILSNRKYPNMPKSIQFFNSVYSWFPFYKSELDDWKESKDVNRLCLYNIKDSIVAYETTMALEYDKWVMDVLNEAIKVSCRGLEINIGQTTIEKDKILFEFRKMYAILEKRAGEKAFFSIGKCSGVGAKAYIENVLELKLPRGSDKIEEKIFSLMDWKYISVDDKNVLKALLYCLNHKKELSKKKQIGKWSKFWYPEYNLCKKDEVPGKIWIEDDFSRERGGQNMVRNSPNMFKSRDGKAFLVCWFDFLSAKLISGFHKIDSLKKVFEAEDPIEANVRLMFPDIIDIVKDDEYKNGNKTHYWGSKKMLEHGNYKIDCYELAKRWKMSYGEVEGLQKMYWKAHPQIEEVNKRFVRYIVDNPYVELANGVRFYKDFDFDKSDTQKFVKFMWDGAQYSFLEKFAIDNDNLDVVYFDNDIVVFEVNEAEQDNISRALRSRYEDINIWKSVGEHTTFSIFTKGRKTHCLKILN